MTTMHRLSADYYVYTWDAESEQFTPQDGVPVGPYSLFELRSALRQLQGMGYEGRRGDNSVLVTRGEWGERYSR